MHTSLTVRHRPFGDHNGAQGTCQDSEIERLCDRGYLLEVGKVSRNADVGPYVPRGLREGQFPRERFGLPAGRVSLGVAAPRQLLGRSLSLVTVGLHCCSLGPLLPSRIAWSRGW